MAMPERLSVKQQLHIIADELPEDATWDELRYLLEAREAVRAGREAMAAGRFSTHEEVGRRLGLQE